MNSDFKSNRPLLFFCEGISYAHIARSLIVAGWLKNLNKPIIVACPSSCSSLFAQQGWETVNVNIAEPASIYRRLRNGEAMYQTEELIKYLREDEELIAKIQPSAIASEFRFTALQLAKQKQIAAIGITEATCHPHFIPEGTTPDPFAKPTFVPLEVFDLMQKTPIGKQKSRQIIDRLSVPYREASQAWGLEVLPTFFDYASQGDICLLCDRADFIPVAKLRPGDIYTGALLWERCEPLPPELDELDPDKKTVYICLGTQESLPTNFLQPYIEQLLAHGLQAIVSRGKRDFSFDSERENLFVFDFINESKLTDKIDLIVYPGGAMSTYQALASGVPLIALPAHANQHFYAEALVRHQVGYFFRPSRLKIDTLVRATLDILQDKQVQTAVQTWPQKLHESDRYSAKSNILTRIQALLS